MMLLSLYYLNNKVYITKNETAYFVHIKQAELTNIKCTDDNFKSTPS